VNLTGKDLGFLDGLDARLRHEVEGRSYFFGFGNRASEDTQGNYSSHEWDLHAYGYWQLGAAEKIETEKLMAYAGPYYRDMRIHTGIVSADGDIDKIDTYFPGLPGRTDGSGSLGVRGGFLYDTRDLEIVPHDGTLLDVYVELNERMRGEGPGFYPRYGVDGHHYFPIDDGIVLMVRGAFEGVSRDRSMPFYLRPALGGLGDLRAFRVGRWHDFFSAAINLDLRFHVTTFDLWGVPVELEMGPILDVGTVFNDFGSGAMDRVNFNPGLQVRLLNRPNLSMGLVGAYGRDGLEVAFGVGLPF
jgi:outer membrane protein assembly factor BamA